MTAREHNNLLSIFFLIQGGLIVLGGVLMVLIYGIMGGAIAASSNRSDEQLMGGIFIGVAVVIGIVMLVYAGLKMRKVQSIGRTLGIVGSILSLFSFPLGTALGVYGLWFFFGEGRDLYEGIENAGMNYTPPPPPNSWQ